MFKETVWKTSGRIGLLLTILPPLGHLVGVLDLAFVKVMMIIGTVLWFASAPVTQKLRRQQSS